MKITSFINKMVIYEKHYFTYLLFISILFSSSQIYSQVINKQWVKNNYHKREVMIPMRDSIHLYTAIYEPIAQNKKSPILIYRSPYGSYPYGSDFNASLWNSLKRYVQKNYIIVFQDVRGKRMSEGEFENVRPIHISVPNGKTDDESDMYDTSEWLLKHSNSNNRIGVTGCSYLGYYALTAAICRHPAIKAVCPQAPISDWFIGDDIHHNGALMLTDAFNYLSGFDRPRPIPSKTDHPYHNYYTNDEYSFFLKAGNIANLTKILGDSINFWNDVTQHPDYDGWWKTRCPFSLYKNINAAVLVVGGLFDAEDAYGTWNSYKTLNAQHSNKPLYLLIGPWCHGGWLRGQGNYLGDVRFGNYDINKHFEEAEQQFFDYYLLDEGDFNKALKAKVFFTGENQWHSFREWPPRNSKAIPIYLNDKGILTFTAPTEENSFSEYESDPNKPVPFTKTISHNRPTEYMVEDQRFASTRPDVITFETQPLKENLTLGGELSADLWVSISTADADFIVKLIDVFPDNFKYDTNVVGEGNKQHTSMGGYEMLVRGDVMRGRYRKGFEHPQAFVSGKPENVTFKLADIAHTFLKEHRIMVQIQSTWFPLVDRNPQQFIDIYHCSDKDFVPCTIKVFHQKNKASKITLPILK